MKSPYWDVIITGRSDATVNGVQVEMVEPSNVYSSVFQHLAAEARQAGRPVLARGVDETRGGRVSWFTVDADGQAAAAQPPAAMANNTRRSAPSRAALPKPRRAPAPHTEAENEASEPSVEPSPARALAKPESQPSSPRISVSPARARMPEPQESSISPVPPDAPPPPEPPRQATAAGRSGPPRQLEGPRPPVPPKASPRAIPPTPPRQAPQPQGAP